MNLKIGVPCSRIKDKIKGDEINVACEETAFGIAAGMMLAGKKCMVYCQNSGFTKCIDIITSLYKPYSIPLPKLLISVRHSPFHHSFVGAITHELLQLVDYDGEIEIVEQKESGD